MALVNAICILEGFPFLVDLFLLVVGILSSSSLVAATVVGALGDLLFSSSCSTIKVLKQN